MHALRREQVLLDLVGDDAEAGFFDGQAGERFGLRRDRRGHRVDDGVDLRLGKLGEDELRFLGAARQRARLGDGREIFVRLRRCCGGSHTSQDLELAQGYARGLRPSEESVRLRRAAAE